MAIALPPAIAGYFAADHEGDADAVSRCFTADALVRDEGDTHAGPEAIRAWKTASSAKYSYRAEPFAIVEDAGRTIVTARLTGDFPGSPLDLRYRFTLAGERIAELEIGA